MIKINEELISKITAESRTNTRKRKNYNFHKQNTDVLQRMLNSIEPHSYVQPHKHESPDKREVFIILAGKALIVEFSIRGEILDYTILEHSTKNLAVEIPPRVYHTIISLQSGTVVYEIKDGPYDETNDKNFAEWAPKENAPDAQEYLGNLLKKLNLSVE